MRLSEIEQQKMKERLDTLKGRVSLVNIAQASGVGRPTIYRAMRGKNINKASLTAIYDSLTTLEAKLVTDTAVG